MPYVGADIRTPPVAVRSDGRYLLEYELCLTNYHPKSMTVQRVEVLGPEPLVALEGETLAKSFAIVERNKGVVPAGQGTVVVLAVFVDRVPTSLDHRIRFQVEGDSSPRTIEYLGTPVRLNSVHLRPPLSGDRWVAAEGPAGNNHHSAGIMPYQGRLRVPQRYAIDFVRFLADKDETYSGNPKDVHSYRAYGAEALAVADARVAAIRDGFPDMVPGEGSDTPPSADDIGGNRVVLDLGEGRFALYAHLQPGSIRVHRGDQVRAGQVLALVGNSMSPQPHLHFQVGDGPTILQNDGLPYVFDSFVHGEKVHRDELPLDGWLVEFRK